MTASRSWEVEFSPRARKALKKLDATQSRRIIAGLRRLSSLEHPEASCKALSGPLTGLWRYRVGDFRVICDIDAARVVILALDVGHRSAIYDD